MTKEMANTFGKRKEIKYVIENDELIKYMSRHSNDLGQLFEIDAFIAGTKFTDIYNVYFDSHDLTSFHDSIFRKKHRQKLRIRSYAINGIESEFCFFEIKSKINGETIKERVQIKKSWKNRFIHSARLPLDDLLILNKDQPRDKVLSLIDRISKLIHSEGYRPIMSSSYRRMAYRLKTSKELRITIDSNLNFNDLGMPINLQLVGYGKRIEQNQRIIEIKYTNENVLNKIPGLISQMNLSSGFSKYCFGVTKTASKFDEIQTNGTNTLKKMMTKIEDWTYTINGL